MNELSETDRALLESLKSKVEELAGLSGHSDLNQKDFDFLVFYIEEKTGQALSLTTLKRIWRNEFQRLPHLSTLNMLSQIAYNHDWHTAKKRLLENQVSPSQPVSSNTATVHKRVTHKLSPAIVVGLAVLIACGIGYYFINRVHPDPGDIQFSATVTADRIIPNSVVFSYDLRDFKADHFYIQQSWDPAKTIEISPVNNKQTDIYYEPGYHYAKLLGNDKVLKEIPVHIKYNDWYVRFRYPNSELVAVGKTDLHTDDYLGLKKEYVLNHFRPLDTKFQLGYMLSKDFEVEADEFEIEAQVKFDSAYAPACPMINLLIKGNKDYAWITFGNKGCESNLGVKVSDLSISGKTNDLSALAIDAFTWQKVYVKLSNDKLILSINDKVVRTGSYNRLLGDLKEIDLFFNGIGSIADVRISDNVSR